MKMRLNKEIERQIFTQLVSFGRPLRNLRKIMEVRSNDTTAEWMQYYEEISFPIELKNVCELKEFSGYNLVNCLGILKNNATMSENVRSPEPVLLNVYDLLWSNDITLPIGLGVFHTGVQVFGTEYAYGGHQFAFTGIFRMVPRDQIDLGKQFQFRESLLLGCTIFTPEEVRKIVKKLSRRFRGNRYHLIRNNCNHFSNQLIQILCGQQIPRWVNRLAHFSTYVPFVQRCIPEEWLTPNVIKHRAKARSNQREHEADNSPL